MTSSAAAAERAAPLRDFEHSLPMQLLRAREAAMNRFRPMLREHGLTEQQWRVIRILAEFPMSDAGEIARRSLLLSPSLSRIVQTLERDGLIRRSSDAQDQRRAVFALTAKGKRRYEAVGPHSERLYAEMAGAFGAERFDQLYELLAEFSTTLAAAE